MSKNKGSRKKKKARTKSKNKNVQEIRTTAVETEVVETEVEDKTPEVESIETEAELSDISVETNVETVSSETEAETEILEQTDEQAEAEVEDTVETEDEVKDEPENVTPEEETEDVTPETEPEDVAPEVKPEKVIVTEHKAPAKKHSGLKVLAVLAFLLAYSAAFIAGAFAIERNIVNPEKYPAGTIINNVDVSGKNIDEAKADLTKEWNKRSISILNSDGTTAGKIKDFTFEYDIDDQLEDVLHPGAEKAISHYIKKNDVNYTIKMHPAGTTDSFDRQFKELPMVKDSEGDKPSKNAYIDKSDTEFRIVKEVIGNSVDTEALSKAVMESIARGEDSFEYRRESFYKPPEIVSNSQVLLDELEYCKKYLSFSIRLRNSVNDYTITPEWLDKMMRVTEAGKVKVNDDKVSEFISNVIYPKFSSTGDTRKLKSAGGGTYTVSGGTYGFTIDTDKEHKLIKQELKERENVERQPNYSGKKPNKDGSSDIGEDFVEVSIAKQMVWVVKGGKVIVETPVVTGNVPRHNTPTGTYYIVYKATNTTLKGHNDDGSEYESHVAYWMPFYLGYGLHDASWRGYFGGSIYLGNGSHGCVNCPPPVMPKIFNACYTGMPVIVH